MGSSAARISVSLRRPAAARAEPEECQLHTRQPAASINLKSSTSDFRMKRIAELLPQAWKNARAVAAAAAATVPLAVVG